MLDEQLKERIIRILHQIAPDADLTNIDPGRRYRDQFEFDSVDFLNFATAIQEEFRVQISEFDYPKLATLKSCINYLRAISPPVANCG